MCVYVRGHELECLSLFVCIDIVAGLVNVRENVYLRVIENTYIAFRSVRCN